MAYFEFDDRLKIENKPIDQKHAVLIDSINLPLKMATQKISDNALSFLKDWLTEPILKIGRKLSDFPAEKSFR